MKAEWIGEAQEAVVNAFARGAGTTNADVRVTIKSRRQAICCVKLMLQVLIEERAIAAWLRKD